MSLGWDLFDVSWLDWDYMFVGGRPQRKELFSSHYLKATYHQHDLSLRDLSFFLHLFIQSFIYINMDSSGLVLNFFMTVSPGLSASSFLIL